MTAVIMALMVRLTTKIIVDFTGALLMRHPFGLGGMVFSVTMLWVQIFPFVALQVYDRNDATKDALTIFLTLRFCSWVILNINFFCTIDLSYLRTFFGT